VDFWLQNPERPWFCGPFATSLVFPAFLWLGSSVPEASNHAS
jgi:hypothetical protein